VYVTESCPDKSGVRLKEELEQLPGINVTLILDSSIGPVMEKIDFVLIGAEGFDFFN
jgi:translation initiation factor eIF-2B subunit alpha